MKHIFGIHPVKRAGKIFRIHKVVEVVDCHNNLSAEPERDIVMRRMKKGIRTEIFRKQNLFPDGINWKIPDHEKFAEPLRHLRAKMPGSVKHKPGRILQITESLQKPLEIYPDP